MLSVIINSIYKPPHFGAVSPQSSLIMWLYFDHLCRIILGLCILKCKSCILLILLIRYTDEQWFLNKRCLQKTSVIFIWEALFCFLSFREKYLSRFSCCLYFLLEQEWEKCNQQSLSNPLLQYPAVGTWHFDGGVLMLQFNMSILTQTEKNKH